MAGYFDGAAVRTGAYWLCELPDRVVLVSREAAGAAVRGVVVSIPRTSPGQLARAPLAPASACTDPCDHDGYTGCSMRETCRLASPIATLATGMPTDSPFGVVRAVDGAACAPEVGVIAACDTPSHTLTVRTAPCDSGARLVATLDGRDVAATFADSTFTLPGARLTFAPSPSLTVGGARESCYAFAVSPF